MVRSAVSATPTTDRSRSAKSTTVTGRHSTDSGGLVGTGCVTWPASDRLDRAARPAASPPGCYVPHKIVDEALLVDRHAALGHDLRKARLPGRPDQPLHPKRSL